MALQEEKNRWKRETYEPLIKRYPERKEAFKTSSGIDLPPILIPPETENFLEALGFPGEYPFTRGVQPTMYRGRLWTMRQYAGYATAEESNERYRYLLDQGQTGLSVAFDLPTQIGYDADDPMAQGEVGKVGVSISSMGGITTFSYIWAVAASAMTKTGTRYCSARLKALIVRSNTSWGESGERAMML